MIITNQDRSRKETFKLTDGIEGEKHVIGRSTDSVLPISDLYADPLHASLFFEQGKWYLLDNNSINGTCVNGKKNSSPVELHVGDKIVIGQQCFVIESSDIPPAKPLTMAHRFIERISTPKSLLLLFTLFSISLICAAYNNGSVQTTWLSSFLGVSDLLLGLSIWPLGFALLSHAVKGAVDIRKHLGVALFSANLFLLNTLLGAVFLANGQSNWGLGDTFSTVAIFLIIYHFISMELLLLSEWTPMKRIRAALIITFVWITFSEASGWVDEQLFSRTPDYETTLLPPNVVVREGETVSDFLHKQQNVFNDIDKEVLDIKDEH